MDVTTLNSLVFIEMLSGCPCGKNSERATAI
jgi:hypothetical protein